MQQATSSGGILAPSSGNFLPAASPQPSFVINLCASTTPVGLVHPSHPQLKRFTFFVSRRREEGRERFRLHMGYFSSQEEAEKLLDAVRDIYPAAWAGVAPGQNLRARKPGTAAASGTDTAAPGAAPPSAAPPSAAPPIAAPGDETAAHSLTNVRAAIDSLRDRPAAAAPQIAGAAKTAVPTSAPQAPAAPVEPLRGPQVLRLLEGAPAPTASVSAPLVAAPIPAAAATTAAATPRVAAPASAPTARLVPPAAQRATPQLRSVPATRPANAVEGAPRRAAPPAAPVVATPAVGAREPAATPELAAYAVQLLWSVQPIDMSQIPQLAIFAAYTLYGAEGNRDGRRWYGLRLGFFTDAVSAKQVAQYVRSEFKSVSVVPVTQRERARASAATAKPLPVTAASKSNAHELNFIEDIPTDTAMSGSRPALQIDAAVAAVRTGGASPTANGADIDAIISELANSARAGAARSATRTSGGKRAKLRVAQGTKPVSKHPPRHDGPLTMEETLEILGASTLQLEHGRGELLNDAPNHDRRQNAAKAQRGSRFGRLMDRLAERFSGS